MELTITKLLHYGSVGVIWALIIYIIALAVFLSRKINKLKE
jgi:hypothetical protein